MSQRRREYSEFLKSREWFDVRNIALERTGGHCQFCGDFASAVHHVQYPKRFGEEHPNSTIPVCKRCHETAHGIYIMTKELTKVEQLSELTPTGSRLNYLLSDEGRVYASAKSWSRALHVPDFMLVNFETGLARQAIARKDSAGGALEMVFQSTPVYRWHAVAAQLRSFDREFEKTRHVSRPPGDRVQLEEFHEKYELLTNWGYELQEKAIAAMLNARAAPPPVQGTAVTKDELVDVIKEAIAPRLQDHDGKLEEHDAALKEIKGAVPVLRDPQGFITVKQAIQEQGLDPTVMPLHPRSRENLSGLAGQMLKNRRAEQGSPIASRLDGVSEAIPMNTYKRGEIYSVIHEIMRSKQESLF